MLFTGATSFGIILHWFLLGAVIIYLPTLIRTAKLSNLIDVHMTSIIRAAIIAYLIINVAGLAAWFISRFVG